MAFMACRDLIESQPGPYSPRKECFRFAKAMVISMKKILSFALCAFICCLFAAVPALAANEGYKRLMDEADLLTSAEESALLAELDEISERQGMDVVVVTVYSLEGKSPMNYADDYFDYHGYGQGNDHSGVLLLHSPEERDWWISTCGYGIEAFTDAGIDYIGELITPNLADGDNAAAYHTFAEQCDRFISQAKTGEPFDTDSLPREPLSWIWIAVSIAAGFVIALIIVGSMKSKLKMVRFQAGANSYLRQGSMNVTESRDLFLYRHVSRTAKPKSSSSGSSTHSSSSGRSHGGGGGKY
ncbi:Domain of uncharacterised function (DUF477) [uncultured Clostridium sp.]|nr:Domain of uncharacterised function (DUF477) [uncultured Clostridium sp.]